MMPMVVPGTPGTAPAQTTPTQTVLKAGEAPWDFRAGRRVIRHFSVLPG